jgi:hypothetical protein
MKRREGHHSKPQLFDRITDGRVFTCNRPKCAFAVCTDCDRPEHVGESCAKYLARSEPVEELSGFDLDLKTCPSCSATYALEKGCGHTVCICRHRSCDRVSTVAAVDNRTID